MGWHQLTMPSIRRKTDSQEAVDYRPKAWQWPWNARSVTGLDILYDRRKMLSVRIQASERVRTSVSLGRGCSQSVATPL